MPATTYQFEAVRISEIKIGERHRKEFKGIEELGESLNLKGLLHPIVITKKKQLVAGGRRLAAAKLIGWLHITVHYLEDLSSTDRKLIELEENIKRVNLTWQEESLAVKEFHDLNNKRKGWTAEKTASVIGISPEWVSKRITVAAALENGDTTIDECVGANAAYNILSRKQSRVVDEAMDDLEDILEQEEAEEVATAAGKPPPPPKEKKRPEPDDPFQIFEADFNKWADTYEGPKFNLIHCDFPYGIGHDRSDQGSSDTWESYEDSQEVYIKLMQTLAKKIDLIAARSCHLIFWFSMAHHASTLNMLKAASFQASEMFTLNSHPLIWVKSDGKGILPDPNRGPRQIYETALFGYRGDRKILKAVANAISSPQGKKSHLSEKPQEVLEHFFRMIVDENTRILDPTCGSGNALAVARRLGARHAIGLDTDPESVRLANRNLKRSVNGRGTTTDSSTESAA